jgi:hypothetical protein
MFDPDCVEHFTRQFGHPDGPDTTEYMVMAIDYDQLLTLYCIYKQAFEDVMEVEFSSSEKDEDFQSYLKSARDTIAEAGK